MSKPCKVGICPCLAKDSCAFGYCSLHCWVACDPSVYQRALDGKLNSTLKEFALDIGRGIYPRKF